MSHDPNTQYFYRSQSNQHLDTHLGAVVPHHRWVVRSLFQQQAYLKHIFSLVIIISVAFIRSLAMSTLVY